MEFVILLTVYLNLEYIFSVYKRMLPDSSLVNKKWNIKGQLCYIFHFQLSLYCIYGTNTI